MSTSYIVNVLHVIYVVCVIYTIYNILHIDSYYTKVNGKCSQ